MPTPTQLRRTFGARMKALRDEAGKTLEEAGAYIGTSHSSLSRVETGRRALTPYETSELLDFYGVPGDSRLRTDLVNLARQARKNEKVWYESFRDVLHSKEFTWLSMESEANRISGMSALIPVYFQTESFMRSVISAGAYTKDEVERILSARMQRRNILDHPNGPEIWMILDEGRIMRTIGGAGVLAEQLEALMEWSEHPKVVLQIIPLAKGAHNYMSTSYTIFDFEDDAEPVVAVDTLAGPLYFARKDHVQVYRTAFDHHRAAGLAPDDTVTFLNRLKKGLT